MVKINPIEKSPLINNIKKNLEKPSVNLAQNPIVKTTATTLAATGVVISTFLQDFNKTSEKDNYFQFKIDKTTGLPFKPDIFQTASAMNLYLGNDVLVTAPTGTGKTAIAQYVITKNLKEGGRTFYTTPLKALSNEKFLDFSKTYGEENVGLITGDTKINTDAPIIIMTTEVYRNMAATERFNFSQENSKGIPENVKTVIFDELQYLGDVDRGGIWEQSIMFTPKNIQILSLSATIGNNEEINNWIASTKNQKAVNITPQTGYLPNRTESRETVLINVPPEKRHVPLNFSIEHAVSEIKVPRGVSKSEKIRAKKEGARLAQSIYAKPKDESYKSLTKKLHEEGKLPAIYFVFSKKDCRHLLKYLSTESELLTNGKEQKEIDNILEKYRREGIYLGESLNIEALKKGYAIHNAGLLPSQKRLVEELFQKKLVKVVLATETLSAGINMPAKTTVISSPRKPTSTPDGGDDKKRNLTPNEFHQMAGRAGRRGIDTEGFCLPLSCNLEQTKLYQKLMESPSNQLDSNINLDYSFIANYVDDFNNDEELEYVLSKSLFAYKNTNSTEKLIKEFHTKKEILSKEGFISKDGKLTDKGYLLKFINGYEQIPILNIISDKTLDKLTPIQIAGIVGGLANIEYNTKDDMPQKHFELKRQDDETLSQIAQKVFDDIKQYNSTVAKLYPNRELYYRPNVVDHLFTWAELNKWNPDSKKNWKELYSGELRFSIKDEGTLFKEITMTADLLKQLIEISKNGAKFSSGEGKVYYENLAEKFQEALNLISREPVV